MSRGQHTGTNQKIRVNRFVVYIIVRNAYASAIYRFYEFLHGNICEIRFRRKPESKFVREILVDKKKKGIEITLVYWNTTEKSKEKKLTVTKKVYIREHPSFRSSYKYTGTMNNNKKKKKKNQTRLI